VSFSADPTSISAGTSSTLNWSSAQATSCDASGDWTGPKAAAGDERVTPAGTATYTLTCTGTGGSASRSETVSVTADSGGGSPPSGGGRTLDGLALVWLALVCLMSAARNMRPAPTDVRPKANGYRGSP
jgi:hypothetical protein